MLPKNICLGIMFLIATTVGTIANLFLFTSYMLKVLAGRKMSSFILIFIQLTLVNTILLVTKGIPQILQGLGRKHFLDDVGCKVVFYLRKVSEGLSISLTCLLCTFQAITISHGNSRWTKFKVRVIQHTTHCYLFCWILNLMIEIPVPVRVRGPKSNSNIINAFDDVFCTLEHIIDIYLIMTISRNVLCLGFMGFASGYMVLLLHKHHQHAQKIRSTNLSSGKHPEIRAIQTILLLMNTFVSFYVFTSIFTLCLSYLNQKFSWMLPTAIFMSLCYPTISPFVLLIPRVLSNPSIVWIKKKILILTLVSTLIMEASIEPQ
ncbi:LOW QUALITY PROTEIN: vomeronasal type-1 receptor 4-like [Sarcophilus harrisii]|uniref:LOW QUALITY PROTEIN: vomeronasal type-1 receptor 4-like n=1 Tax=Sarcophilus harrisii TaxID=9305 RepID=UPI000C7E0472|nr:LOW QUALITY PROTEIN: vomeronasal type-1 receptor 4-like [Sarcophilus harrisii]